MITFQGGDGKYLKRARKPKQSKERKRGEIENTGVLGKRVSKIMGTLIEGP